MFINRADDTRQFAGIKINLELIGWELSVVIVDSLPEIDNYLAAERGAFIGKNEIILISSIEFVRNGKKVAPMVVGKLKRQLAELIPLNPLEIRKTNQSTVIGHRV